MEMCPSSEIKPQCPHGIRCRVASAEIHQDKKEPLSLFIHVLKRLYLLHADSARAWSFHNTDEFVICLPVLMKRLSACVARGLRRIVRVSRRYAAIWLTFSVGVKGRGQPKVNRAQASPSEVSVDSTWQSCLLMFPLTLSRCLIVPENDAWKDKRKQGKYSRLLLNKELVIFLFYNQL